MTIYVSYKENNGAGIGHNSVYIFYLLNFISKFNHIEYIHTPFLRTSKDYDKLFGFNYTSINKYKFKEMPNLNNVNELLINKNQETTLYLIDEIFIRNNMLEREISSECLYKIEKWKEQIRIDQKKYINYDKDCLNISVHIRRGDIMSNNIVKEEYKSRFLSEDYFLKVLQRIETLYNGKLKITIISEGKEENFENFKNKLKCKNIKLLIGRRHLETIDMKSKSISNLIFNDILITSPSGLSFLSSLYSTGVVIATNDKSKLNNPYLKNNNKQINNIFSINKEEFNLLLEKYCNFNNKLN